MIDKSSTFRSAQHWWFAWIDRSIPFVPGVVSAQSPGMAEGFFVHEWESLAHSLLEICIGKSFRPALLRKFPDFVFGFNEFLHPG